MSDKFHRVIGIDLGTTYSAVAAYNKFAEASEIINNKAEGDRPTTPSVVSLDPILNKAIVGYAAKRNLANDPENTIIEIKREMGENFRPETLKKFGAERFYSVEHPLKVHLQIPWLSEQERWFTPQEISAFILTKMKEIAEVEIGEEIRDAVVTVPAYFTEKQKKATEEAALLAGLYPRQLIPEPTAAAICYGVDKFQTGKKTFLVYDLGGGTFDVSIIVVEEQKISVVATSGDSRLGGSDFDEAITKWALGELKEKHGRQVQGDRLAEAYIKARAEDAKILLSTFEEATLELTFPDSRQIYKLVLTRDKFNEIVDPFLKRSLAKVEEAIKISSENKGVKREHIDAILLVGGSTKIPKALSLLLDYFGKSESFVLGEINPDSVVARGAAIMAYKFAPSPAPFDVRKRKESTLNMDFGEQVIVPLITEHSLGVEVQDSRVERIVNQATSIPVEITRGGFTNPGPTPEIIVNVFQGEGSFTYENTLIGSLHMGPLEPKPMGEHKFEVTFKLDENGLLSMIVHHINENKTYEARFDQKTSVGGEQALVALRNKVLKLYAQRAAQVPREAEVVVPPPHPAGPAGRAAGAPPEPPRPAPEAVSPPPAEPRAQGLSQPTGAVEPPPAEGQIEGLLIPTVEVPDQFKQIVRRAKKQLLRKFDRELFTAFNAFVTALNLGKSEEELEEVGDDLADAHEDARDR